MSNRVQLTHFSNSTKWTLELGQAQTLFSKVIEDYRNELMDLSSLLELTIGKFKPSIQNA